MCGNRFDFSNECLATKTVTSIGRSVKVAFQGSHSHDPPAAIEESDKAPPKSNGDMDVMIGHGLGPNEIHTKMTLASNGEKVPSIQSIKNRASYLARSSRMSKEMEANFGDKFLLRSTGFPQVSYSFAAPYALSLMKKRVPYAFVDGTFKVCSGDMILTTLMLVQEGIGFPAAFLISQNRLADTYVDFFRDLQRSTEDRFAPEAIISDFELGFRKAVGIAFPNAMWYGDKFHFIHDNIVKLAVLGGKTHASDLAKDLRELWAAPDVKTFNGLLTAFTKKWEEIQPKYASYFTSFWTGRVSVQDWALFGRGKSLPSGDQWLESWHRRLKCNVLKSQSNISPNKLALLLFKEVAYYEAILTNDQALRDYKAAKPHPTHQAVVEASTFQFE